MKRLNSTGKRKHEENNEDISLIEEEENDEESDGMTEDSDISYEGSDTDPEGHDEIQGISTQKKAKLQHKDLYKPPTNQELNQLKETETLFHSSLFRLQISELMSEIQLKEKRKSQIDETVKKLFKFLRKLPQGKEHELQEERWINKKNVKVPIQFTISQVKGKFQFHPPQKMMIIGSYLTESCIRPQITVDVAVQMPKIMLQQKDYLNHRYTRKRALFLSFIAVCLKNYKDATDLQFTYHHGNRMKPILSLMIQGKEGKPVHINLHVMLEMDSFKLNRFHVTKNNIRRQWYTGQKIQSDDSDMDQCPTPHYNSAVLRDLTTQTTCSCLQNTFQNSTSIKEALMMLKVWLRQRELCHGYGNFSSFHMSMYMAYLVKHRKLTKMMSSYQVVRNTLLQLSKSNWNTIGISLCDDTGDTHRPELKDFHQHFDVVFVDPTGYLNLCSDMNSSIFQRVQHEAELALQYLETPGVDSFTSLFITPLPFQRKFDNILHIPADECSTACMEKLSLQDHVMDFSGDAIPAIISKLVQYLKLALDKRVQLMQVKVQPTSMAWDVSDSIPFRVSEGQITVGLILNSEYATNILEKGPPADSLEAKEFRDFWGEKSELRRFKDGSICEAVAWMSEGTLSKRRTVCRKIITHTLERHFGIKKKSIVYINNQLDSLLWNPVKLKGDSLSYGTGEEENQAVVQSYDSLCKILRSLKDLPLTINSIQGTSPVFRYAEVFPLINGRCKRHVDVVKKDKRELPDPDGTCPAFSPAMKVVCQLEGSGKWPDDLEAFRRLKAAFHIKLGEVLTDQQSLPVLITPTHVDVLKDNYVFRVELAYLREIALMKLYKTPEGMVKYKDTPEALKLEREIQDLPKLTSMLHGLQQQYNTFSGTVRLVKRWVSAQLMIDHITEEAIELTTAYLYISPAPYTVPNNSIVGFQRWLYLLSHHDWMMTPLLVNLNNEFTRDDFMDIPSRFQKERSSLPLMFIATPDDKTSSMWTRKIPTAPILQRLVLLAQESLKVLSHNIMSMETSMSDAFKQIFRPPMELYDVVIHLRQKQCARHHQAVDISQSNQLTMCPENGSNRCFPVIGFDPVELYLQELKAAYSHLALFFHDRFGGSVVAVLWKPSAFSGQEFKVSHVPGCMLQSGKGDKDLQLVPNVEAIIQNFRVLGGGLVHGIETRTEKWKI